MKTQTTVFKWEPIFSTINCLENHFSEKFDVSNSKFERMVLSHILYTMHNRSKIMGYEDIERGCMAWCYLKILVITN